MEGMPLPAGYTIKFRSGVPDADSDEVVDAAAAIPGAYGGLGDDRVRRSKIPLSNQESARGH